MLAGDRTADGAARLLWNWDRQAAYGGQPWWPFHITAWFVSYAGFALSAWIVARAYRQDAAMLLSFVISVTAGLAASAAVFEILTWRAKPRPAPPAPSSILSPTLPHPRPSAPPPAPPRLPP